MEGDGGDIEGGQEQGGQHAQVAQHRQHGGHHPALGLVLGGLEELADGAGDQPPQGQAVHQDAHPSLHHPGGEAVGPLCGGHQGEGGVQVVHDILLQVSGGDEGVDVDGVDALLHRLHQLRVGQPLDPQDVHRGDGLAAHQQLLDLQAGSAQAAADQGGVGPDGLHEGVPGPFEGRLVLRLGDRALLLGAGIEGEADGFPGKEQQAVSADEVKHRLVHGGPLLHAQVVEGAVPDAPDGAGQVPHSQGLVLGQGPQHIVAYPLHADHAADVAQGELLCRVAPQVHRPVGEVHAAVKDLLQALQAQGQVDPGLLARMGRHRNLLPSKKAHGSGLLSRVFSPGGRKIYPPKGRANCEVVQKS